VGDGASPLSRAWAIFALGTLASWVEADNARATPLIEEARTILMEIGDLRSAAEAVFQLAFIACIEGDISRAEALADEGEPMATQVDAPEIPAGFLIVRALIARARGEMERADRLLDEALAILRGLGSQWTAWVLLLLAALLAERDAVAEALRQYAESARMFIATGSDGTAIAALRAAGAVAARHGHYADAARLFGAGEALGEDLVVPLQFRDPAAEEQAMEIARDHLGEEAFAAAWERGQELSLEQAISLVEEVTTEAAHPAPDPPGASRNPAGLSERELEVLRLVAEGLTNAQVAERLYLSPRTVDAHLRRIYDKLGASSRAEAVRFAVEQGLS
jgi:non-specific serine/threonine protein kinase